MVCELYFIKVFILKWEMAKLDVKTLQFLICSKRQQTEAVVSIWPVGNCLIYKSALTLNKSLHSRDRLTAHLLRVSKYLQIPEFFCWKNFKSSLCKERNTRQSHLWNPDWFRLSDNLHGYLLSELGFPEEASTVTRKCGWSNCPMREALKSWAKAQSNFRGTRWIPGLIPLT
jgi:hypothetical protein